ncbi:DUF3093 domain-containing protein [Mycobacterium sp.]|uniref:DUF3093 domain-containing protein n=1 Tax=Mycobacterium sp. TaxID=1785 RepID=UPI003A8BDEBA
MTAEQPIETPLFYEPGASWYWVLAGPLSALSLIYIQWSGHAPISLAVPGIFMVVVSAFVALQVHAARIHTSVELTEDALRQGTETIRLSEIVKVFPEPENSVKSGKPLAKWQSARALGEIVGVPRGRYGIGLRLTGSRTAQAWARKHRHMRDVLTPLIEQRMGPFVPSAADEDPGLDDLESQL